MNCLLVFVLLIYVFAIVSYAENKEHKEAEHKSNISEDHSGHDHSIHKKADVEHDENDGEDHSGHDHSIHKETDEEHDDQKCGDHSGHDHSIHKETDEEHDENDGEDHSGHDHSAEEEAGIKLSAEQIKEAGIKVESAKFRKLQKTISLLGDITINEDLTAHVVSRVPGCVKKVRKTLGDKVKGGEILAELESRELADAKANYLAANEKFSLEESIFAQEDNIFKKQISSEREFLNARHAMMDSRIDFRSAKQKLMALGLSKEQIKKLPEQSDGTLTHFEIKAPFDGTIISKHITLGEVIKEDKEDDVNFVIANLDTVWVNLRVSQKDLPLIHIGQRATISVGSGIPDTEGTISFVSPVLGEKTRAALARLVITNTSGMYRPGLFVTARVSTEGDKSELCVPASAVQNIDGENVVFLQHEGEFEIQPVTLGINDGKYIEITSGLKPGNKYVSNGAFELKTKVITSGMDAHAGHGH